MVEVHTNLVVSPSKALTLLFTKIRDKKCSHLDFVKYSKRAIRILAEDALAELPTDDVVVNTPTGGKYNGLETTRDFTKTCVVSIMRSGDVMMEIFRDIEPGMKVGKILVQRDESSEDKTANFFYEKLPAEIKDMDIILCDPMVATGGSAISALDVLCQVKGVDPKNITFATMICAPPGLKVLAREYPAVKVVTAVVDEKLDSEKFIVPGLGDFGDRFYGT